MYNFKSIIKDVNGKPVPQYWNPMINNYEVVIGKNGKLSMILVNTEGVEIQSQNLVDQITAKLTELIEVVR